MTLTERIVQLIEQNRISTTEVADAMGKKGHVPGLLPLVQRMHKVGLVDFVYAWNDSNWEVHEQIQHLNPGRIVYVHGMNCDTRAIFGDLVSKYILLYRKARAIAVNGMVRDAHTLIKENYPVWSTGVSPIGCFNRKNETQPPAEELAALRERFQDAIMVLDDTGVVLIEKQDITEELYEKLQFIELQEDVWFFCMDTHKMSTYEIVCQKKYLREEGIISRERLAELSQYSDKLDTKK